MGLDVPVQDITTIYNDSDPQNMLVNSVRFGAALAAASGNATSESLILDELEVMPVFALLLQRYHGFSTAASSLTNAVYQAVYAKNNAQAQSTQLQLRRATNGDSVGSIQPPGLDEKQISTGLGGDEYATRAWQGFAWEVGRLPQYVNACVDFENTKLYTLGSIFVSLHVLDIIRAQIEM